MTLRLGCTAGIILLFMMFTAPGAWGAEFQAHVERGRRPISEVQLTTEPLAVSSRFKVKVRGHFNSESSSLIYDGMKVELDANRNFSVPLRLIGPRTSLTLIAVDVKGEVTAEDIQIRFPEYEAAFQAARATAKLWSGGLALTSLSYQSPGAAVPVDYSEVAFTGKIAFSKPIPNSLWSWGGNAFLTLLPASTSDNTLARFLGINARAGYLLPLGGPWHLNLLAGFYYSTMFVTENRFGYRNVAGPQIYPALSRLFGDNPLVVYFKFSPVSSGMSFLSLDNYEMALGGAYTLNTHSWSDEFPNPVSLTADFAQIQLKTGSSFARSRSLSLGASYSF